jgi:hypothetical protein
MPPNMAVRVAVSIVSCLSIVGCGPTFETEELRGLVTTSFEHNGFTPCGGRQAYWFDTSAEVPGLKTLHETLEAAGATTTGLKSAYIEMTARLAGPGQYGHLGQYRYQVSPVAIARVAAQPPPGCSVQP